MRTNLPVTATEYAFPSGQTLVSTTDTKGRILYCNPLFIEVSGYTREELLGQPHNLIRHPDMPEEAFRDMWETIASGKPWSAPVKNRRKNGDYYWVMANATPLMDGGRPVGYMSVRTEASREQVRAAEVLYAQMRSEKTQGQRTSTLKEGRLVRRTVTGWLKETLQLGAKSKIFWALVLLVVTAQALAFALTPAPGIGWASGAALQLGLMLGSWAYLSRLLVSPLGGLVLAANRMAAGDLTHTLERTRTDQVGELQAALNQLSVNLKSIVRDARNQGEEMVHGTSEIAQGNLDLSQRTESQASNLEQTAASMEEITSTVRASAESAAQASAMSAEVVKVSERGSAAVDEVSQTMQSIKEASGRISEITQVIDGIAFQTNILALNAAVEAARAGEQGRGFAVVASEVRSLAQRTSTAAKEIKRLIDESAQRVETGRQKTDAARQTIAESLSGVQRVSHIVNEISDSAREQLDGIAQINSAVGQLDAITQQNASLVEEMASAAKSLETLARATTETVQVFRVDNTGSPANDAVALRRTHKPQPGGQRLLATSRTG